MTHRPIQPIAINGFEPGGTPRAYPIFEDVDPCTLLVDEGYQRDLSERSLKLIRRVVSNWDWSKFKAPIAVMTDAGLELLDGQCTSIAAATHPEISTIPVMIVDVKRREERAAAFIGHNKDRVAVTAVQLHVAAVAAGDAGANAVERVCRAAGLRMLRGSPGGQGKFEIGDTMAVAAIGAVIRDQEESRSIDIMKTLLAGNLAPITGLHIKAAELLLTDPEYSGQITAETLATTIATLGKKAEAEADVFRATHPSVPKWKALAITWFKARRARPVSTEGTKSLRRHVSLTGSELCEQKSPMPSAQREQRAGLPMSGYMMPKQMAELTGATAGKKDSRPALSGWKPGVFLLRCSGCDEKYQGDRKSRSCADCAYGTKDAIRA